MDSTILSEQTSMTAATLHLEDELEQMDSDTGTAIAETTENTDENNSTLPVASPTHPSTILEISAAFSDSIDIGQVVTGSYSTTDPKSKYLCLKHNHSMSQRINKMSHLFKSRLALEKVRNYRFKFLG